MVEEFLDNNEDSLSTKLDAEYQLGIQAIDALPDAWLMVNRQGVIERVNHQATVFFALPRRKLVGQPYKILLPDRFHSLHDKHFTSWFDNPESRPMGRLLSLFAQHHVRGEIPVSITLAPLVSEDVFASIVIREKSGITEQVDLAVHKRTQAIIKLALDAGHTDLAEEIKKLI